MAQAQARSAPARAAGVTPEVGLRRLGPAPHRPCAAHPVRGVRGATDKHHPDGTPVALVRGTKRLALAAALLAVAYRYRGTVALFCRGLNCLLGGRPLLSQSETGVQRQVYRALRASLLISLWGGQAPTKRTFELLCFYLSGWASTREVLTHVARLHLSAPLGKK